MSDVASRVIGAASQGAVGAMVGALLSAVTEPIVNRVLVKRIPLKQAIEEVDMSQVSKFFETTLPTNFIKFPFFEVVNLLMTLMPVSPSMRGTVTGMVFTTTTLPITNYRYRKSMNMEADFGALYQAYIPTVMRDIVYGIVRNQVTTMLIQRDPEFNKTNVGRFCNMFLTVLASCVISAPGNEYRGYCLQPKGRELPFMEFFKPERFIRSTSVGALIMSTALGTGALLTPQVQGLVDKFRTYCRENPLSYAMIVLWLFHQYLASKRAKKALEAKTA